MEVHAHTHTARKKWTHYFWEFLMLFLAVFCGFLAEYQLEHKIEKQRAKVYAVNLYEELKKDTTTVNYIFKRNDTLIKNLDTFCLYSSEKKERNITNGMLYYYGYLTNYVYYYTSNSTTIEQLKGSGNLRLLGNELSLKISEYGKRINELQAEYGLSRSEFEGMESLYFKIFDGNLAVKLFAIKSIPVRDTFFKIDPPLVNEDPQLMKEFTGWVKYESDVYSIHNNSYLTSIKKIATELILLLKNKYHLE